MIRPEYLQQGDKIGIIAPARKVSEADIEFAIAQLRDAGFEIEFGKNLFGSNNQFSGTDNERAADLQHMIDQNDVKAIYCARGGYGCVRIVDEVDWSPMVENPKWMIGFSDITVFHSHIHHNLGIETLHANMLVNFKQDDFDQTSFDTLINSLKGEPLSYEWKTSSQNLELNKHGEITAEVVGGNLSMLHTLSGTSSDLETIGKILFLEDIEEYLYHIDRMMMNLKRSGKLENIAALVIGGMTKMNDNQIPYGKRAEEIIREHAHEFGFPIAFDFPAGHLAQNVALLLGREAHLEISDEGCSLTFSEEE